MDGSWPGSGHGALRGQTGTSPQDFPAERTWAWKRSTHFMTRGGRSGHGAQQLGLHLLILAFLVSHGLWTFLGCLQSG